ncbi:MAG: hypothetical protein ABIN89_13070 [Chitinophagaceae bacterium]
MRKFITLLVIASAIASCNDKTTDTEATKTVISKTESISDTTTVNYAYTIEHPDQWETGSKSNTEMVLKTLKAFENGNMDDAVKDFADSVKLEFDNFEAKMSKDSLMAFFKRERIGIKNMRIVMDDFESVKSKVEPKEYVSLWYKQIWQDQKGKTDSIECMDDLEIKNGKIVLLSEKIRHYPAKKM